MPATKREMVGLHIVLPILFVIEDFFNLEADAKPSNLPE